ncbi:rod shape-determining protein RodA, partial [candidate division WWE3 bacterium]|nr:rod shape-determining protein RodA [candidate division WWE3 bacterium]
IALVLGVICAGVVMAIDFKYVYYITPFLYIVSVILLVGLLFYTDPIRGIKGWFVIGPLQIQPAEFVKIATVLTMAAYIRLIGNKIATWLGLFGGLLLLGLPLGLIILQPDLGTALVLLTIGMGMLFFSDVDLKKLFAVVALGLVISPFLYANLEPYQQSRITSFLNPDADPLGTGYNQIQSEIAVGSGNLVGRGWGRGTQSHLQFLPEQHTDFIFATFAEEFGFLGSFVVIALYVSLVTRIFYVAFTVQDQYFFLITVGMALFLAAHVIVNVGMNIGVLPVAGLPLPLMSYGGSSVLATVLSLGIIESVAIRRLN